MLVDKDGKVESEGDGKMKDHFFCVKEREIEL